jgi:hypothetical protein
MTYKEEDRDFDESFDHGFVTPVQGDGSSTMESEHHVAEPYTEQIGNREERG